MRSLFLTTFLLLTASLVGCQPAETTSSRPKVGFVTNGIDPFWVIAAKGVQDGGKEFDAEVEVRMPPSGVSDQKRMVEDLIASGIEGIAISPIDPDNQGDLLDEIAAHAVLITQDSDAPASKRVCYVGMDNYTAGRMCGQLVKKALPKGGNVMIFVGRLAQANARVRRQGVIDELMDRTADDTRYDSPEVGELKGGRYTVLDTRTDDFDFPKAKAQAQEAITRYDELNCMVGLFAYNPPLLREAVIEARKLDQIKIVAFDEAKDTLQGIADGEIYGTIVQNPYRYGYESVRILAGLLRGDQSVLPENQYLNIQGRSITKDNVEEFRRELERLMADSSETKESSVE